MRKNQSAESTGRYLYASIAFFLSCIQEQECKCFSAYKHRKVPYEEGKRKFIYTGIDSDLFFFVEKMAICLFS